MSRQPLDQPISARQSAALSGRTHYYGADCPLHGHVMRYVCNGMCMKCQREAKQAHRVESGEQTYPSAYHSGRHARSKRREKLPPAILSDKDVWWWLAGWNDRDLEMTRRLAA